MMSNILSIMLLRMITLTNKTRLVLFSTIIWLICAIYQYDLPSVMLIDRAYRAIIIMMVSRITIEAWIHHKSWYSCCRIFPKYSPISFTWLFTLYKHIYSIILNKSGLILPMIASLVKMVVMATKMAAITASIHHRTWGVLHKRNANITTSVLTLEWVK